jgi:putative SOS response-associated peptidase YedK
MCGRFAFFQEIEPLIDDLDAVDLSEPGLRARWNIAPTAPIYVVTESLAKDDDREPGAPGEVLRALRVARWGLLPPFAQDLAFGARTFNARRESLASKPSFRGSLAKYRAIIPISGYYEWRREEGSRRKQPYFISDPGGEPLHLAGLVSWWKGPGGHEGPAASADGNWLLSATIITREAVGTLAGIHDRTPLMLPRSAVDAYLSPDMDDREEVQRWLLDDSHVRDGEDLELRPVDPAVGSTRSEGPELIDRTEPLF